MQQGSTGKCARSPLSGRPARPPMRKAEYEAKEAAGARRRANAAAPAGGLRPPIRLFLLTRSVGDVRARRACA